MNYSLYIIPFLLFTIFTPSCSSDMTTVENSGFLGETIEGVDIEGAYKVKIVYGDVTGVQLITSNEIKKHTSIIFSNNIIFIKSSAPMSGGDSKREIIISTEDLKYVKATKSAMIEINSLYNNIETIKASNNSKIIITEYSSSKENMDIDISNSSQFIVKTVMNVEKVFNLRVSTSSNVEIEKLNVADCVNLTATNNSSILIKSGLSHLQNENKILAKESSVIKCLDFSTFNSSVIASLSSEISVNTTSTLKIEANKASKIYCKKNDTLNVEFIKLTDDSFFEFI